MSSVAHESEFDWVKAVREVLRPHLHQIPYGNLRAEYTSWMEEDGLISNLAVVYEVPGGSTNQINITFHEATALYAFIDLETHAERETTELDEVLAYVRDAVDRIPTIRRTRLQEDIDRWAEQGLSQKDLFQKMTKLLQIEDLRGGTITMQEMKAGIAHILEHYRTTS